MDNINKDDYYVYKKVDKQKLCYAIAADKEKVKNLAKNAIAVSTLVAMMAGGIALTARAVRIENETRQVQMQDLTDKQSQSNAKDAAEKEQKAVYGMTEDEMRGMGYSEDYISQIQIEKMLMEQNKPQEDDDFVPMSRS